ncbi:hypothetical protein SDC9_178427 [bioreactor metagenome]|uniref:Uncharacterized protein n=1 Tax=bioreactor metagenome TaxID=1076179 RepID=A0A645GXH5_9ZZZZ
MDRRNKRPVHAARLAAQIAHLVIGGRRVRKLVEPLCNAPLHLRRRRARKGQHKQALHRRAGLNSGDDALRQHGGFSRACRRGDDQVSLTLYREQLLIRPAHLVHPRQSA